MIVKKRKLANSFPENLFRLIISKVQWIYMVFIGTLGISAVLICKWRLQIQGDQARGRAWVSSVSFVFPPQFLSLVARHVGRYISSAGVATGITTGWRPRALFHPSPCTFVYKHIYIHSFYTRDIFPYVSFLFYRDAFMRIYLRHLPSSTLVAMFLRIHRLPRVPFILL